MSIYTDMIGIIEERGLCNRSLVNAAGECCLLGAAALAKGIDPESIRTNEDVAANCYTAEGIEELSDLCIKSLENANPDWAVNGRAIFRYNDQVLRGDEVRAISLLWEADSILQSKTVV